jgi:GAF domain-containing protein
MEMASVPGAPRRVQRPVDTPAGRGYPWSVARRDWSASLTSRPTSGRRTALGLAIALAGGVLAVAFVAATKSPFQGLPFVLVIIAATIVGRGIAGAASVVIATMLLDFFVLEPTGRFKFASPAEFWALITFAATMIVVAQLVGWLESVGERERLERERAALLVRIGDAMSSAVGEDRALSNAVRLLVPAFADWSVVHLVRGDGSIRRAAAVHAQGGELEEALTAAADPDPDDERGAAAVIRTGSTERYTAPTPDEVRSMAADDGRLEAVSAGTLGSSIVVPLVVRDRTIGALTLVRSPKRVAFSERDVSFAEEIGERAALVVDNARLVDLERRSAGLNAVLQELTAALSASVTASDVGRTVVEQGTRALGAAAAAFALRLDDGRIELRESSGHPAEAIDARLSFSIDDPLPLSLAMRTGRPVVLRTIEERDRRFPALRDAPPFEDHALVCLPFIVRGSAIGGLAVTFGEPRTFEAWELAFMESIAAQAGQALDRALLFESEREANARLETGADRLERLLMVAYRLSRAHDRRTAARAVVESSVRAADAATSALLVVEAETNELVLESMSGDWAARGVDGPFRFPMSSPFASAEAARTGHPVWIESPDDWDALFPAGHHADVDAFDPIATAGLPLVVAGRTLAVLALGFDAVHAFDEEERDFLLTLAGLCAQNFQAALVLEQRESARAEAELAREQIEFLAEATRLLSSSLDVEATIAELGRLCVPRIADWMTASVVEGPNLRQLVLSHSDPGKIDLVQRLQERLPFDSDARTGPARVLRTGESELIERVDDQLLKEAAPDAETLEEIRSLGLTSAVTVPLSAHERVLGTLTVAYAESGRHYDRDDLTFIESLGRRAAVAIDNARLFRDREDMARALQRSLLPRRLPSIPGVELAVRYIPFGEGNDVGGDFYDVFSGLDDGWGLLIGDVCGKGPEAASIVGIARHTVRGLATGSSRPSAILDSLNRAILDESPWDRFCTAAYVRLRADGLGGFRATVSLAGHLPPLVVSPDGSVRQVGAPGSLLGVLEHPELSDTVVDLSPGDLLVMYTDGLEEPGRDTGGFASVGTVLSRNVGRSADDVADELLRRFRGERGVAPRDDVAIVAVRIVEVA